MGYPPTLDQEKIINYVGNSVVIAKPGTGKTLTLAYKIQKILIDLPYYKGVIAISYTNKASDELKQRSLSTGVESKNSFFGTMDKFLLKEIIMPFGERIFGKPVQELSTVKFAELDPGKYNKYDSQKKDEENFGFFCAVFQDGLIVLEKIGFLALHILENSSACQRYLKARFSHVIIDEYQDCGFWQHQLFSRLVDLRITGIAMGDIDQSIFVFAGKSSEYLLKLAALSEKYKTFSLLENHRCHPSIVNYSARLITENYELQPINEIRVYSKDISGSEIEIAQWLSKIIPIVAKRFDVDDFSRIGVLVKTGATSDIVHRHLTLPHKVLSNTPLDESFSLWGSVFRKVLIWAFSSDITKYELVESYLNLEFQAKAIQTTMGLLRTLENHLAKEKNLSNKPDLFINIAETIFPSARNRDAIDRLETVLNSPALLSSFIPAKKDEVQILTLHKSKGLEFDIVFHLNLYRWILPQLKGNYHQDLNLHYVGVTRARKCCVLCTSSYRHNKESKIIDAEPSEFLYINSLELLRKRL